MGACAQWGVKDTASVESRIHSLSKTFSVVFWERLPPVWVA